MTRKPVLTPNTNVAHYIASSTESTRVRKRRMRDGQTSARITVRAIHVAARSKVRA